MFFAHVVIDTMIAAFEQSPKRFDAVCVSIADNVFLFSMLDPVVIKSQAMQTKIREIFIRINERTFLDVLNDVRNERLTIHLLGNLDLDFTATLQDANQRSFVVIPHGVFAFALAHVRDSATNPSFVRLNAPEKLPLVLLVSLADAMCHEPRRLLSHANMLGQLHGRNALAGGRKQINGDEPFPQREFAFAEHRAGLDGEILFALGAAIPLAVLERVNFLMAAMRAILAVAKANFGVVLDARCLVTEKIRELGQCLELKCRIHSGSKLP